MAIEPTTDVVVGTHNSDPWVTPRVATLSTELGAGTAPGLEEAYVKLLESTQRLLVGATAVLSQLITPSELHVLLGLGIEPCPQHAVAVENNLAGQTQQVGSMVQQVERMKELLDAMRRRLEEVEQQDQVGAALDYE